MDVFPKPVFPERLGTGDVIMSPQFEYDHGDGFVGGNTGSCKIIHSRAKAKFVVINAFMDNEDSSIRNFPNGWCVVARRLNANDTDDGLGEKIHFYQHLTNGNANYGVIKKVKVIGRMEQRFV